MRRISIALLLTLFLTACRGTGEESQETPQPPAQDAQGSYEIITAQQAKQMMDSGEEYLLVDVRTREEYTQSRIEGAVLIPVDELSNRAEQEIPDKNTLIILYCRSGRRSEQAAGILADMGYSRVYDMGGIMDWPYETLSG